MPMSAARAAAAARAADIATSRIEVFVYPSAAKRPAAVFRISSRRRGRAARGVSGTDDADAVSTPLSG
jgi:hypothetical protein